MNRLITLALCAGLGATICLVGTALATPGPPLSIASFGGVTSLGTCTDSSCRDLPRNSWSTGANPSVQSQFLRLEILVHGLRGPGTARFHKKVKAFNFASNRFQTVADLEEQAQRAAKQPWRLATVEIGVGDVCTNTPASTFRTRLARALTSLARPIEFKIEGLDPPVGRQLLVSSIEDLNRHWQILPRARRHLDCGLGPNASQEQLARIRQRTVTLNEVIAKLCYRLGCFYDGGAHFRMPLRATYFSATDPRYLSIDGQRALAATEWPVARAIIAATS